MQGVFREMGLTQDEESLHMVKQAIAVLPQTHPLRSYLAIAPDLEFGRGPGGHLPARPGPPTASRIAWNWSPVPDWSSRTGCSTRPTTRPPW